MNINLHGSWYVTILENTPVGDIHITMTMIMGWVVLIVMSLLCWILGLISLVGGVWSPTADLATEIGWGAIAFVLITKHKIKASGLGGYLKSYLSPIFLMAPINVISELATPVSMACRHFGNILSGMVIGTLIYSSLGLASRAVLGLIPGIGGWLGQHIPIFEIGLPAITSLYFDWFSGLIQPFIFCILTCIFIKQADEG